ncbi:MAG: DUF4386 domain-containing protein [Acidobacteria bacterium]|nr:DUF4386 domain-containing protein [Acidobacteriota bacterium]
MERRQRQTDGARMTRSTNARIAGATFLVYIAVGLLGLRLWSRATAGVEVVDQLAGLAQHATDARFAILLTLVGNLSALVLAVTLYAITKEQDADLAMIGLTCRVAEGICGMDFSRTLGLLWLATATDAAGLDAGARAALGAYFFKLEGSFNASATFFAIGSTLFSWLLLRGRMVPAGLAWLGVLASVLLVVCLPLQLAGLLRGPVTQYIWMPMLLFEVPLGLWLIVKGVAPSTARVAQRA